MVSIWKVISGDEDEDWALFRWVGVRRLRGRRCVRGRVIGDKG